MPAPSNQITYLDGPRLYRALIAGIRHVIAKQEYLNDINVFPVPDRDTGTNLALTLNAVIDRIYLKQNTNIHQLLEMAADAAIDGARGNSGAIFAQFLVGFSTGSQDITRHFTTKNFVAAIATASNFAHKALSDCKEGTILTVMRDFSDTITQAILTNDKTDFVTLLTTGIQAAKKSCENTAFQLKECRKAKVVDAGAQGFLEFLIGIQEFVMTGAIGELGKLDIRQPTEEEKTELSHSVDERYRYCTECLIIGDHINHNELRQALEPLGNSLIVAGSHKKTKVHVHANDPADIFNLCRGYGTLKGEKADDMIQQQHSTLKREQGIAILTDSGADFPEGTVHDLNIHTVPLQLSINGNSYIDKVSISTEEFYEQLQKPEAKPKTSQPSLGDFKRQYDYLMSHYESVIAIHIPKKSSGTLNTSQKAADTVAHLGKISIIDCKNVSASQGLIVMQAARAAQAGMPHDDIVNMINTSIQNTQVVMTLADLEYAVQGGRLSLNKKRLLDLCKIKPILTIKSDGSVGTSGVIFGGDKQRAKKLAQHALKKMDRTKQYSVICAHANNVTDAKILQDILSKTNNIQDCAIVETGAALAAHSGPGGICVAFQEIPTDTTIT